jgi:hypothetical protein
VHRARPARPPPAPRTAKFDQESRLDLVAEGVRLGSKSCIEAVGFLGQSAQETWTLRHFSQSCGSDSCGVFLPLGERGEQYHESRFQELTMEPRGLCGAVDCDCDRQYQHLDVQRGFRLAYHESESGLLRCFNGSGSDHVADLPVRESCEGTHQDERLISIERWVDRFEENPRRQP